MDLRHGKVQYSSLDDDNDMEVNKIEVEVQNANADDIFRGGDGDGDGDGDGNIGQQAMREMNRLLLSLVEQSL